jgi:hypothetical protein
MFALRFTISREKIIVIIREKWLESVPVAKERAETASARSRRERLS